jgi:phospholipase C
VSDETLRRREFIAKTAALAGLAGVASAWPVDALVRHAGRVQASTPFPSPENMPIDTFVVLMQENRSFDHYFGWHPGADAKNAGLTYPDDNGVQHPTHSLAPDFQGCAFEDPDHSWEGGRRQYDGGRMDGFRRSPNDDFAIGYYNRQDIPFLPALTDAFTLYDRYFCSLLGPTWPNREYMHSAQSGGNKTNADPQDVITALPQGGLYHWETIWDRMIAKGLSVTYYYSDLPFIGIFGPRYLPIIKPVSDFYADAAAGRLPNLAFIDPMFLDGGGGNGLSGDEHPHGDIRIGQAFMSDVVHAFISSPQFRKGAMFINYDEWGGFFDHVPPRLVPDDRQSANLNENFGITGLRIPGVAISPYAGRGHVSHMTVTHESILKLVSYRFGLGYLTKRHRYASNIGRSFDWEHPRFDPPQLPDPAAPVTTPCSLQSGEPAAGGMDSAAERAEKNEGLHIGSPEMLTYLDALGYPTGPADPSRIFSSPDSTVKRLATQITGSGAAR